MSMSQNELGQNETVSLISADKVEGTPVYTPDGERMGAVEKLMIEKRSGHIAYAVMSFGGFLGIGEELTPLPWEVLTYDTNLDGYVVALPREQLQDAPSYAAHDEPDWADRAYSRHVDNYFGVGAAVSP